MSAFRWRAELPDEAEHPDEHDGGQQPVHPSRQADQVETVRQPKAQRHRQHRGVEGHPGQEGGAVDALNGLGEAAHVAGDHDTAAERYRTAAADAERIGYEAGRATALRGLASDDLPPATAQ